MNFLKVFNRPELRILLAAAAFIVSNSVGVFAQCEAEPKFSDMGSTVHKVSYTARKAGETSLSIKASVPGGSWQRSGSEAAVLTVFVDGKYNQDVILFAGSKLFEYKILLGRLEKASHEISLSVNKTRSARNTQNATITHVKAAPVTSKDAIQQLAIENAPIIYARENTIDKFSDIPLVTYYETLSKPDGSKGVRYSTIFTNEDGGTQTTALLARWGRATDIEWVYEVSFRGGKPSTEIIQGANHVTSDFRGLRTAGVHPLINDVTDNNNFSDKGCTEMRFAPLPQFVDLSARSRETVMDDNPWTHRIMAQEAIREGRVDVNRLGPNVIDDPSRYIYADVFIESDRTFVAVELAASDGQVSRSDHDDRRLRINRPGYQRIAVRIPPNTAMKSLKLLCFTAGNVQATTQCGASRVTGYTQLAGDYSPKTVRNGH